MKQILIQEKTFEKARNEIRKSKGKTIIFSSNDDDLNRKVLEKEKIDILLINLSSRKDFQKQRNSGFNHVLAKIAKKKEVIIGINLDEIIQGKGKKKSEILSRVRQNIKICNKNKLKMNFIAFNEKNKTKIKDFSSSAKMTNERNMHDLKALGLVLEMPTWMTKEL